ncbi:MAG: phosphotransferase [Acidimicrobiales bacterium]
MADARADMSWVDGLVGSLGPYLSGQRWFASSDSVGGPDVSLVSATRLSEGHVLGSLWQVLVRAGGDVYQLVLVLRDASEPGGVDPRTVVSVVGDLAVCDALGDPEAAIRLLEVISGGGESAERCRPVTAEQSNTSVIFDDRLILKVFRRLRPGRNPDAEVTSALAGAGFANVAAPVVVWGDETYDFAFAQTYLAGGSDGWALALASLRDLYSLYDASGGPRPAEAGGDFAPEAARLGQVTAQMHQHLSRLFPAASSRQAGETWESLIASIRRRLAVATERLGRDLGVVAEPLITRAASLDGPGPAIRVHGDLHLGQVMRTDQGWFVLDFEGEPDRPLAERLAPASALRDVSGMLRSFHYASRFSLREREPHQRPLLHPAAIAWEARNRTAFLSGYRSETGVDSLMPDAAAVPDVTAVYELDKALYELDYEMAHRPEWVDIPLEALERLVDTVSDERNELEGEGLN